LVPGSPLTESLVFNAYFVDEPEFVILSRGGVKL
jgi:hypothetical protein